MAPFSICSLPSVFCYHMSQVLSGLDFCCAYLNDKLIYSTSLKEHLHHLEAIFKYLKESNLKLKLSKCQFFKKHLHYLGHLISEQGIQLLSRKVSAIQHIKRAHLNMSLVQEVIIESSCHCFPTFPNPSTNFSGVIQSSSGHSNVKHPSNILNKGTHSAVPMYKKAVHVVYLCQSLCIFQHPHPGSLQS